MKTTFHCFRLQFPSGIHLGRGRPDYTRNQELLHSDTIKSALFAAAHTLEGEAITKETFLDAFRISSAFPFIGTQHFFPLPALHAGLTIRGMEEHAAAKKLRKARFISLHLLEKLLRGEALTLELETHFHAGGVFLSETAPVAKSQRHFSRDMQQKVTLRNPENNQYNPLAYEPTPYHIEMMYHGADAGWFFLARTSSPDDAQTLNRIQGALSLLQDSGIGMAKSTGAGQFTFAHSQLTLSLPEQASHQLALGLYAPLKEELAQTGLQSSGWGLMRVEGYIASAAVEEHRHLRKRRLTMFTEGSVFAHAALSGALHDVAPQSSPLPHPVYREGRPLFLPLHLPRNHNFPHNGNA